MPSFDNITVPSNHSQRTSRTILKVHGQSFLVQNVMIATYEDEDLYRGINIQVLKYDNEIESVLFLLPTTIPRSEIFIQRLSEEEQQNIGELFSLDDPSIYPSIE